MSEAYIKSVLNNDAITKSAEDKRLYRTLELTNGMKVMLVSDPTTDKSSAALDLYTGHMKDPRELPGLAHFCEHMLFLGTKKYPEENEYKKFLSEHGGSSNAFTSNEHTNYFFDIAPDHLANALDRFAQFFLCPLFTESATEREVNAVNSENDKNLQNDSWRFYQLDKALADPTHDYSKFGTGNKCTLDSIPKKLGYDVRDELLKFHSSNYSANLMGFCILGRETLDELAEMAIPLFSQVENKSLPFPQWDTPPFGPEQSQKICSVVPVMDLRTLALTWSIPDLHEHYKTNPGHYLGHLIGHEGQGSLLSELKSRGWVNTLVGGQQTGAKGFMFFIVNVDLTVEGLEHVDEIITLTYQYINMLKKEGPKEWIFKECQDLGVMQFRFKEKEKPRSYTSSMASVLHEYPAKEVLCAQYLQTEYKPELVALVLDKLVPTNMRVAVMAKKFESEANSSEQWYGTQYKLEQLPAEKLTMWETCGLNEKLRLPLQNEFIPVNFDISTLEQEQTSPPTMIKDTGLTRLWYKQDDTFFLPKTFATFEITSPVSYMDPLHANLSTLFSQLFTDALNEYAYDAEIAGLKYSLSSTAYGINITIKGYTDKLDVLLKKVMEKLATFQVDKQRFDILKETYERSLQNFHAEQPHQHAIYFTNVLMSEVLWTIEELTDAMEEVTVEKLQAFLPELLSKLYIECLVYGNITRKGAISMVSQIEDILQKKCGTKELLPSQKRRIRELQLPSGCYYMYKRTNQVHKSSSIEIYYQCGQQETRRNMLLELTLQIISEPCFSVLRTKEQLGYIVFSGIRRSSGVQGLRVIVQSDREPQYVEERIEAFLQSMIGSLQEMTAMEFQKHVTALATKRLEKPKKMPIQFSHYWTEIASQQYNFDRDNIEVTYLKTITKDDIVKFFKETISGDGSERRKLSVHVLSTAPSADDCSPDDSDTKTDLPSFQLAEPVIVEDIPSFKRDMALYPLAKPFIDLQKAVSKL